VRYGGEVALLFFKSNVACGESGDLDPLKPLLV